MRREWSASVKYNFKGGGFAVWIVKGISFIFVGNYPNVHEANRAADEAIDKAYAGAM